MRQLSIATAAHARRQAFDEFSFLRDADCMRSARLLVDGFTVLVLALLTCASVVLRRIGRVHGTAGGAGLPNAASHAFIPVRIPARQSVALARSLIPTDRFSEHEVEVPAVEPEPHVDAPLEEFVRPAPFDVPRGQDPVESAALDAVDASEDLVVHEVKKHRKDKPAKHKTPKKHEHKEDDARTAEPHADVVAVEAAVVELVSDVAGHASPALPAKHRKKAKRPHKDEAVGV